MAAALAYPRPLRPMLTGRIVLRGRISFLEIGPLPNKSRPLIQQGQ